MKTFLYVFSFDPGNNPREGASLFLHIRTGGSEKGKGSSQHSLADTWATPGPPPKAAQAGRFMAGRVGGISWTGACSRSAARPQSNPGGSNIPCADC